MITMPQRSFKLGRPDFLAVCLLAAGLNPLLAQDNLLSNGGFEEWGNPTLGQFAVNFENGEVPRGWISDRRPDDQSEPLALVAKDVSVKHGGEASVRLEPVEGVPVVIALRSNKTWHPAPVAVEPGKKHIVRGWVKGENLVAVDPKGKVLRAVVVLGDGGDFFAQDAKKRYVPGFFGEEGTSDWIPFQFEFETSPDEVTLFFMIRFQGTGKIWLDDLEIVPLPDQPK